MLEQCSAQSDIYIYIDIDIDIDIDEISNMNVIKSLF